MAWVHRFDQLCEFKEQHGHTIVPGRYTLNPTLGQWVNKQRQLKRKGKLKKEREELLDSVGFVWKVVDIKGLSPSPSSPSTPTSASTTLPTSTKKMSWHGRFDQLCQFKEQHGHTMVPRHYKLNKTLGLWVNKQRSLKKEGSLKQEKEELLNSVGFVWDARSTLSNTQRMTWNDRFDQLCEFKEQNGHTIVPRRYTVNPSLGQWVIKQRLLRRQGKLGKKKEEVLNSVGFVWEAAHVKHRDEDSWDAFCQELKDAYNEETKIFDIAPISKLSEWVAIQRKQYKRYCAGEKVPLTEERIEALRAIGFDFRSRSEQLWDLRFRELKAFKEEHGHCSVPLSYSNAPLANWVSSQRKRRKRLLAGKSSTMTRKEMKQLGQIGFVWELLQPNKGNWNCIIE